MADIGTTLVQSSFTTLPQVSQLSNTMSMPISMAATNSHTSFGSSGPSIVTDGKQTQLLEKMQLVEHRKRLPVPNHLLESKVYTKVGQNGALQARPSVVHFAGFQIGETHSLSLHLLNTALDIQRMHVIPPQTSHFSIKYTKQARLMPGSRLECVIQFKPDEWRYYYDCVRIHSEAENLLIPIHAYPVMSGLLFPTQLQFAPVSVGFTKTRIIPLRCQVPIDFEFQLSYLQPHPAFQVEPMSGVVPANGQQDISVTFAPTQFNTCCMQLQLMISQFQAKPLICNVIGSSQPFVDREEDRVTVATELDPAVTGLDPRAPLDRARAKRARRRIGVTKSAMDTYEGIPVPKNVDTPHAVAKVLMQVTGKISSTDLRNAVTSKSLAAAGPANKQMKEALFERAVRRAMHEERQNQLRWQVKLGGVPTRAAERDAILGARADADDAYEIQTADVHPLKTTCNFARTKRDTSQVVEEVAKFDILNNNMWRARQEAITGFQAAGRKIILRLRVGRRLRMLRELVKKKKKVMLSEGSEAELPDEDRQEDSPVELTPLNRQRVKSVTFPTYVSPKVKDDMAVDALGEIPFMPIEVNVKKKVPFFNLKVPQLYRLMGYEPRCVHYAASNYIAPHLQRTLRKGAEDEIIQIALPSAADAAAVVDQLSPDVSVATLGPPRPSHTPASPRPAPQPAPGCGVLAPPQTMLAAFQHHALHIFNPSPGVQVFQSPLPYSETDSDFHLCPLPRFPQSGKTPYMSTQKKFLNREDLIRGLMSWKKFPSQGLTSLSLTPTLTSVWVPRWNDPFGENLISHGVPELYDGLPEEDARSLREEEERQEHDADESGPEAASSILLTPEMITAEFQLLPLSCSDSLEDKTKKADMFPEGNRMPATNIPMSVSGPVPREKREQELDYFLKRKYNKLGARIQAHIRKYDDMKTDHNLIMK